MSEELENTLKESSVPAGTDVMDFLQKILQQLDYLEKKVDMLVKQSQDKPREKLYDRPRENFDRPYSDKRFSKPSFRPGGGPSRYGKPDREHSFRGGNKEEGRPSFEKRPSFDKRPAAAGGFNPKKKFFQKRKAG